MAPRIVLVRHGPSAHIQETGLIDRVGVQRWRDAYDSAGIHPGSQPPTGLVQTAAHASEIIASDLPRSVASAERLAPHRPIRVSALLRETPLAIPHWPTRLPLAAWEALIHLGWSYRILRGTEATGPERARAGAAAEWLDQVVPNGSTALVITHGAFRRLLAQHLELAGWMSTGRSGGYSHWSSWTFAGPVLAGRRRALP